MANKMTNQKRLSQQCGDKIVTPNKALKAKVKYIGANRCYEFIVDKYDKDGVYNVHGAFKKWESVLWIEDDLS